MNPALESGSSAALALESSPGLLDLPSELFAEITDKLSIRDLARLAAASKDLHALLQPQLYIRDDDNGSFRALLWAICSPKAHAVDILKRACTHWPRGTKTLNSRIRTRRVYKGNQWSGLTPLLAAIKVGNYRVVRFLLSVGVNVNRAEHCADRDTLWYPIHHAVMRNCFEKESVPRLSEQESVIIIKLLLDKGADPDQLSLLNPHPPSPSIRQFRGMITPIHLAITVRASNEVIYTLLQGGAAVTLAPYRNSPNQPFSTITPVSHLIALHETPSQNTRKAVQLLLVSGGSVQNHPQVSTDTTLPLLLQCLSRPRTSPESILIAEAILKLGAGRVDETASNGDGIIIHFLRVHIYWRPTVSYNRRFLLRHEEEHLMAGTSRMTRDVIDTLLRYQADINKPGAGGHTALHIAAGLHRHCSSILFPYLIHRGANVKAATSDRQTMLHSLLSGDPEADYTLVTTLVRKYKINRYSRDGAGNTFLHLVVSRPISAFNKWMKEVAKHYKRSDFEDPKLRNKAGHTPMEEACLVGGSGKGDDTRFWIKHAFDEFEQHDKSNQGGAQGKGNKRRRKKKHRFGKKPNPGEHEQKIA